MLTNRAMALFVLLVGALSSGCGQRPPAAPSAVAPSSQILITIEAIAPKRLAPFGETVAMPKWTSVAAAGTTYDDAITTSPVARPALATILTGVSPDRSGVRDNIDDAVADSAATLAEQARHAGFETVAFVSTPFASYSSGLQRGFDLFDGPEESVIGPSQYRPPLTFADELAGRVTRWLASHTKGKPVFVWIHLADLNGLATPPPGSAGSSVWKSGDPFEDYDKALGPLDHAIGTITDALRHDPATGDAGLTIVGTHGVYLGGEGPRGDAFWLADETLRIPLVRVAHLSDPANAAPRHDSRPTWLPDVAASLARAFGGKLPSNSDGIPLEDAPPPGRARLAWAFAPDDQLAWPPLTAVKEGESLSVFSASKDGKLSPVGPVTATASSAAAARPALPRKRILTESMRSAALKAGVKLGSEPTTPTPPNGADVWLRDLQVARGFLAWHRTGLAARAALRLLKADPSSLAALQLRLYILSRSPSEELTEIRDRLLALYPDRSDALHWAAHVYLLNPDYVRAAALLDAAIAVGPVEPEIYYDRACVHVLAGETKPAFAMLDKAFKVGYRNWDWLDRDPDLAAIRTSPEFLELLRTHGR